MNAKVLLTALSLGGAAVYAVRRFKAKKGLQSQSGVNNKMQRTPAFSPTKTPTPPY
jgi:hypothetical protein